MSTTVTDIRTFHAVNNKTAYFLDTNVLYWYVYPRYTIGVHSSNGQASPYIAFVDNLVKQGNPLFTSVYNLTELLHIIEKNEFELYRLANQNSNIRNIKDFRSITSRSEVKANLFVAFNTTKSTFSILEHSLTSEILEKYIDTANQHRCDVFDYITLKYCIGLDKYNIISDDSDFSSIDGIHLFTSNQKVLQQQSIRN